MRKPIILLSAIGALAAAAPGAAQPARDSRDRIEAFRGVQEGEILPLNVIKQRISARMRGATLIGADMVGDRIYRLRYIRGSNVIMVDVDARTGRPLRCMGC